MIGSLAIIATGCKNETTMTDSELVIEDLVVGTGDEIQKGDTAKVHYTGTLEDGTIFDSSIPKNRPFEFKVGAGSVITGWDEGVPGMKIGGSRKLTIPPSMAYGEGGIPGVIPASSTLIFEVELLEIL